MSTFLVLMGICIFCCNIKESVAYSCLDNQWKCKDNKKCIRNIYVCDGRMDCKDASDEMNCQEYTCLENYRKCGDGRQCVRVIDFCDGHHQCNDRSDESNCEEKVVFTTYCVCPSGYVKCRDGKECISEDFMCNMDGMYFYCKDGSDEDEEWCRDYECGTGFSKCMDGMQCIVTAKICNSYGIALCNDGSDLENC